MAILIIWAIHLKRLPHVVSLGLAARPVQGISSFDFTGEPPDTGEGLL
jgi:hypothetical protein